MKELLNLLKATHVNGETLSGKTACTFLTHGVWWHVVERKTFEQQTTLIVETAVPLRCATLSVCQCQTTRLWRHLS